VRSSRLGISSCWGDVDYPPEDGETYLDNARIKARFGREVGASDRWMLADDSGIELDALDGCPRRADRALGGGPARREGARRCRRQDARRTLRLRAAADRFRGRRGARAPASSRDRSRRRRRATRVSASTRCSCQSARRGPSPSSATPGRPSTHTGARRAGAPRCDRCLTPRCQTPFRPTPSRGSQSTSSPSAPSTITFAIT